MEKKLNLGCGEFKKEGYVNVDFFSVSEPDVKHNLDVLPYPFADSEFDLVEADHLLEHLSDPFAVLKELRRITKDGGLIKIKVPHFSRGFTHPEHKRGFDATLPYYFNPSFPGGYQGVPLILEKMNMSWFAQPYFKKKVVSKPVFVLGTFFGKIFDFLANLSPLVCSRVWCFWVGGFEEIEFHFRVKK
jgi:SAM-dependent methyltransferase